MASRRRTLKIVSVEEESHRGSASVNTTMALPLFSRTYLPRSRPGSAARDSRPTSASPTKSAIGSRTSRLRTRLAKPKDVTVSPELAAQVVKDYLIPLFEADARNSHEKRRDLTFGRRYRDDQIRSNESKRYAATKQLNAGTIYEELKLSDKLRDELLEVRQQAETLEWKAREAEQQKESISSEVRQVMLLQAKATADLQLLQASYSSSLRDVQSHEQILCELRAQLLETQRQHSDSDKKCNHLSVLLHEERARSDKLKNKAWELEHNNDLLRLENSIMGEQLKGLYQAISQIAGSKVAEEIVGVEVRLMGECLRETLELISRLQSELQQITTNRDTLQKDLAEAVELRDEMKSDRARIFKQANDKFELLQTRLQATEEERDRLRTDEQKYEKRFKDLSDEYEKLRGRMNQYRLKRRQFGEVEEKMCRLCQRVYSEAENFNWSCRTHSGEFAGEMWWCCGKTGRDSIGCKTCKHESKDDESDVLAKDKEELEQLRLASVQCPVLPTQSCKEFGHRPSDCPRDPNLRSKFDLCKEMDRIATINMYRKAVARNGVSQSEALTVLSGRSTLAEFHNPTVATSPLSSILDSADEEEAAEHPREFFDDIQRMKRRAVHSLGWSLVQGRSATQRLNSTAVEAGREAPQSPDDSGSESNSNR